MDAEQSKDVIKLYAPESSIARILTISSDSFRIESAVYREIIFTNPIAYSSNKSKYGSFVFELPKQKEPYYLVLSHVKEKEDDCFLYDLKIVIVPKNNLGDVLECKINAHKNILPPVVLDFSLEKLYGSDQYAIFDK